jgi:hypothetical protein
MPRATAAEATPARNSSTMLLDRNVRREEAPPASFESGDTEDDGMRPLR